MLGLPDQRFVRLAFYVGLCLELCLSFRDEAQRSVFYGGSIKPAEDNIQVTSTWYDSPPFLLPETHPGTDAESEVWRPPKHPSAASSDAAAAAGPPQPVKRRRHRHD